MRLVAWSQYQNAVETMPEKQFISKGCDAARINISGMRDDKSEKLPVDIRRGGHIKIAGNLLPEFARVCRIPTAGNYRLPNLFSLHGFPPPEIHIIQQGST
jgi:hypothetical protein